MNGWAILAETTAGAVFAAAAALTLAIRLALGVIQEARQAEGGHR